MTTPRFLILPHANINIEEVARIVEWRLDSGKELVRVVFRNGDALIIEDVTFAEVTAALREAMKGPELPLFEGPPPLFPATDIAQQARETREAGGGA